MRRHHSKFAIVAFWTLFLVGCAPSGCGSTNPTIPAPNATPTPNYQSRLYVAEGGLNQVAVLDASTGAQIATIPVGKLPAKMVLDAQTSDLYVANAGDNTVSKIDTASLKVVSTVAVGTDPEWVDLTAYSGGTEVLWVANRGSKTITQLNSKDMSLLDTISTSGGPLSIDGYLQMVSEDNGKVVLFENSPPSLNSTASFTVANGLQGATNAQDANGNDYILIYTAYDGKVSQYKPTTASNGTITGLQPTRTYQLPVGAGQIYGDGKDAFVVNDVTDQISDIDLRDSQVAFTTKLGNAPVGFAYGGGYYYVANRGDDTISELGVGAGSVINTFKLAAGAHPDDVAYQYAQLPASPTPSPTATASPTIAPTATPTSSPTSTPGATQHVYVANGSGGNVLEYTSPFSASSTPSVNLNIGGNVWGVASDNSYVAIEDSTGYIYVFAQPLSSSASPIAQFQGGGNGAQLLFDSAGNLYTAMQGSGVLEYSPPFSNSSTPVKTIFGDTASFSLAMDYNNNLYVGNLGMNQIDIFASPYTGSPTKVARPGTYGLASYATYLYGADAASGKIDVYNLPMNTSSTPAFTISNTDPHGLAADVSTGTLYVGDQLGGKGSGAIDVYKQPLSGSSSAAYSITASVVEPVQVWIGP